MNTKKTPPEFVPCAEQMALMPEISGNTLNGLGETARRPPTPIYWHHPSQLPHGKVQQWMIERTGRLVPEISNLNHQLGGRGARERAPKAPARVTQTPEQWAQLVKDVALAHEADLVGVARFDPTWVFNGYEVDMPWVIVLGMAMDHARLATAPEPPSVVEVMTQYNRGTRVSRVLADWICQQGYDAIPHGGPQAGPITMIPAAIACGFGELGKHGSIINRTYGSSFRLACVLTDMPLVADAPETFGVDAFCLRCQLCTRECPPEAIFDTKHMVRGDLKWYVDFDKCVPYFNETYGCGICIAVCPWSRPGLAGPLAQKMTRWQERHNAEAHEG
ncbi:MAG: 4Fe-4S dicluster domain-containing protein [Candidatus Tectomicrobia bacterium]